MRLTIIEPSGSSGVMRARIEALLAAFPITYVGLTRCPSDKRGLARAINGALKAADLIFVVGGLGRDGHAIGAAAQALSQPLVYSQKAARRLEQKCSAQQLSFTEHAHFCTLPKNAKPIFGDGLPPACICAQEEYVVFLFDENADEALLLQLKSLLAGLCRSQALQAAESKSDSSGLTDIPAMRKNGGSSFIRKKRSVKETLIGCTAISCVVGLVVLLSFLSGPGQADRNNVVKASASVPNTTLLQTQPDADPPVWQVPPAPSESSEASSEAASSSQASSQPVSSSSSQAASSQSTATQTSSSQAVSAVASSSPVASSQAVSSSAAPEASSQAVAPPSSEPDMVYVYDGEDDETDDEDMDTPSRSGNTPSAHSDAFDEKLTYTYNGKVYKAGAYDLVCEILQNETRGNLAPEALKAHAVATYSMLKYNNAQGIAPSVLLNTDISSVVKDAVDAVLGVAVYYNGSYANTVYHSTSAGYTTSSQAVWGGALPYLVSTKSSYDAKSPYYKSSYTISEDDFAGRVKKVYGISLSGDPEEWIVAERNAPGGYVGTVTIGGKTRAQGGTEGTSLITGRSVREKLFAFALRSHCFDVSYNASKARFEFTVYGYGHGVGMSQYGAHYMALDGYDYVEILEHYYKSTEIY